LYLANRDDAGCGPRAPRGVALVNTREPAIVSSHITTTEARPDELPQCNRTHSRPNSWCAAVQWPRDISNELRELCDDPQHHAEPTSRSMARGYSYRTGVVLLDQWRQPTPGASLQPVVSDRATGAEESDDQIVAAAGRRSVTATEPKCYDAG